MLRLEERALLTFTDLRRAADGLGAAPPAD